jgi:hypothetical protein
MPPFLVPSASCWQLTWLFFYLCCGTLGTAATTGLLYQPRMIGDGDCGEIGGMKVGNLLGLLFDHLGGGSNMVLRNDGELLSDYVTYRSR